MPCRLPFALAALAALLAPAEAAAKELSAVELCGPSACARITDRPTLDEIMRSGALGGPATAPPALGPFYRLRVTVDAGPAESVSWSAWYAPDAGRVTGGDPSAPGWLAVQAPGRRALERLAAPVEPHHTPELAEVLVRRRPADDPAAYARSSADVRPPCPCPRPATGFPYPRARSARAPGRPA